MQAFPWQEVELQRVRWIPFSQPHRSLPSHTPPPPVATAGRHRCNLKRGGGVANESTPSFIHEGSFLVDFSTEVKLRLMRPSRFSVMVVHDVSPCCSFPSRRKIRLKMYKFWSTKVFFSLFLQCYVWNLWLYQRTSGNFLTFKAFQVWAHCDPLQPHPDPVTQTRFALLLCPFLWAFHQLQKRPVHQAEEHLLTSAQREILKIHSTLK